MLFAPAAENFASGNLTRAPCILHERLKLAYLWPQNSKMPEQT